MNYNWYDRYSRNRYLHYYEQKERIAYDINCTTNNGIHYHRYSSGIIPITPIKEIKIPTRYKI